MNEICKMQDKTHVIHQELLRLLPPSIIEDVACFVLYDNHPRDVRRIDITICTKNGELKEYYHRDLTASIHLKVYSPPTEIIIHRNSDSELFYIVAAKDELQIVSYTRLLQFHSKISNVDKYAVDDWGCNGQTCLKVIRKDDAVPIFFDENFKSSEVLYPSKPKPDSLPIFSDLKRKYIEARYSVCNHEKSLSEYIKLRHAATLCAFQKIKPNSGDSLLQSESDVYGALKVKTRKPWVKVCNKKIIVALHVRNEYKEDIDQLHMILNSTFLVSLSHTTKIFSSIDTLPFWEEETSTLHPNREVTVVAVMNLDEIQPNVTDRIVLKGALSYRTSDKAYLLPFEEVAIPSLETFGDAFDALSSNGYDADTMLAILSTTEKTNLRARLIKSDGQTLIELLTKHLQMERVGPDVVIYKKSPYHLLNGAMFLITGGTDRSVDLTAYTRTKSQLLALIHSINDTIPAQIIITTPNYIITTNEPELLEFSEPMPEPPKTDYLGYAKTVLNRTAMILEYLDRSMVKMSETTDPNVKNQIGIQIDLYGCGKSGYKEFREKMMKEEKEGVRCLLKEIASNDESMSVD